MITNKKIHDNCECGVEWLDPTTNAHYAKMVCIDSNCKRKKKFVQWLGQDDAIVLTLDMNIPQLNLPIPVKSRRCVL